MRVLRDKNRFGAVAAFAGRRLQPDESLWYSKLSSFDPRFVLLSYIFSDGKRAYS